MSHHVTSTHGCQAWPASMTFSSGVRVQSSTLFLSFVSLYTVKHSDALQNGIIRYVTRTYIEVRDAKAYKAVFVTGNANKLREVRAILAAGPSESPIEVSAQAVDGEQIALCINSDLHEQLDVEDSLTMQCPRFKVPLRRLRWQR